MGWTYRDFSFEYLFEELSAQTLSEYARRMERLFQRHYRASGFSAPEFVQTFRAGLENYDPHGNIYYDFVVNNAGANERWEVHVRSTQISHVEGGVVEPTPDGPTVPPPGIEHDLLKEKLASVVTRSVPVPRKGFRRIFGNAHAVKLTGSRASIYLLLKIESIPPLLKKMRWEPRENGDFYFYDFARRVKSLLREDDSGQTATLQFDDHDEVQNFIKSCDDALKSQVPTGTLDEMFALISLPSREWFAARIL